MESPSVSIVIIARNEEAHINKSLEAALRDAGSFGGEIVLVDSGSTDRTLEIALGYPVKVVKIENSPALTAAATRQVGLANCDGDIVFFFDGDCVLAPGWVEAALKTLVDNPDIAGVMGRLDEVYFRDGVVVGEKVNACEMTNETPIETHWVGGNAAYWRHALELADGGFNPSIRSLEELELFLRLKKLGKKILLLPDTMVTHYTEDRWTFWATIGRYKRGLCMGYGQVLRSSIRNGFLMEFIRRESRSFLFGLAILFGILLILLDVFIGQLIFTPLYFALFLSAFFVMAMKNKSIKWPALMFLTWFLNCIGLLQGGIKKLPKTSVLPVKYSVVKDNQSQDNLQYHQED